jgi:thiamine kinase-like enzyme
MGAEPSIEDLLTRVPQWRGRAAKWSPLAGGLSHHICLVEVDGAQSVLRVLDPAISAAGLGIDPDQEIRNTVLAAQSGLGAAVLHVMADVPALVLEYLPGRTLSAAQVREPRLIDAIADACRRLHGGPAFANTFDIFDKRDALLAICRQHELPLPDRYADRLPDTNRIREALRVAPLRPAPCHNDLLAENLIEQADGTIRVIDYQLSGANDPTFDLGDLAAEADYHPDLVRRLVSAYFGAERSPTLDARVQLYLIASNLAWALWFTVHHGLLRRTSEATFDYCGEAADKWGQAQRDLDGPDFGRLLDTAAGRTPATTAPPIL